MVRGEYPVFFYHCKKMKFPIKDFFSKCDQIRRVQRIWSHLLKKPWIEDFIFRAVYFVCVMYTYT